MEISGLTGKVKGILPGMLKTESVDLHCGLVFVPEGIIVAFLQAPSWAQEVLGGLSGFLGAKPDFHIMKMAWARHEDDPPEKILKSNARNFLLPYPEIVKVEIAKKLLRPCKVHLHSSRGILRVNFHRVGLETIQREFRSLLPDTIPVTKVEKLETE